MTATKDATRALNANPNHDADDDGDTVAGLVVGRPRCSAAADLVTGNAGERIKRVCVVSRKRLLESAAGDRTDALTIVRLDELRFGWKVAPRRRDAPGREVVIVVVRC